MGARQGSGFSIGFQQIGLGPTPTMGPQEKVCQMSGDVCTYHPEVTGDQRDRYLCKKQGNQCLPVNACQQSHNCEWDSGAEQLPDASGRTCSLVNNKCRMTKPTTVEGFAGFNKPV
jgi:hypothetical protein